MPTGIYKRTSENLKGIRAFNRTKIGKSHPHSEASKEAIRRTRHINPIRNWKGGITYDPTYVSWSKNKRNRMKRENGGAHTYAEWEDVKRHFHFTCPSCLRGEPTVVLTQDHIVPVSKGGTDDISNIQPLCRSCNTKKLNKIIQFKPPTP